MTRAVRAVEEAHGGIAALINNAGYGEMGPLEEVPIAAFRRQLETNVVGVRQAVWRCARPHKASLRRSASTSVHCG
jgi:NAD(P)-dependent dehydrogenase (short-subunit alcohol dehydrogenase family)